MINKFFLRLLLCALIFLLNGCFDFKYPITLEPTDKIDENIIGEWKRSSPPCERSDTDIACLSPRVLTITSSGDNRYIINTHSAQEEFAGNITAWHSRFVGAELPFVTLKNNKGKFDYALLFSNKDSEFSIRFAKKLKDNDRTISSIGDIQSYLKKDGVSFESFLKPNGNSFFSGPSLTYTRVGLSEAGKRAEARAREENDQIEARKRSNPEFQRCLAQRYTCLAQCPPYKNSGNNDFHYSCTSQCNQIICYY